MQTYFGIAGRTGQKDGQKERRTYRSTEGRIKGQLDNIIQRDVFALGTHLKLGFQRDGMISARANASLMALFACVKESVLIDG